MDAERALAEQARQDAEEQAEDAVAERDALAEQLEKAREAVKGMQAAVDVRLEAIEAKRARASKEAEARAEQAIRERDALVAERETERQAAVAAQAAADERIRALELQLFERDRGPRDQDIELAPLLEAPPTSEDAVRRAERYRFKAGVEVQINGDVGELVDLSVGGAQLFCPKALKVNAVATLSLPGDDGPITCSGRVVWIWLEPRSQGRRRRYRAGMLFLSADEAAVSAFITSRTAS
jgi:hypothetical protein